MYSFTYSHCVLRPFRMCIDFGPSILIFIEIGKMVSFFQVYRFISSFTYTTYSSYNEKRVWNSVNSWFVCLLYLWVCLSAGSHPWTKPEFSKDTLRSICKVIVERQVTDNRFTGAEKRPRKESIDCRYAPKF